MGERRGIRQYRCDKCGRWYEFREGVRVSCCVQHPPGQCCHYGETRIAEPDWSKEQTP